MQQPPSSTCSTTSESFSALFKTRTSGVRFPMARIKYPQGETVTTIPQFDPPAGLTEFDAIPDQHTAWDEFIALSFQRNIEYLEAALGAGKSQYYNPKVTTTDQP